MTQPTARLTWPEIRARAAAFARDWAQVGSERAEAQTFWNEFLAVFGVHRRRAGVLFERAAARFGRPGMGRIDVFWPGLLLGEHKSAGADLDAAYTQATDYFVGIADHDLPRYVVVSDFARVRLYDRDTGRQDQFALAALARHIERFGFIAGYADVRVRDEDPLNIRAVELLGALHDALRADGYGVDAASGRAGHGLQLYLVRLLFCLFADDTGIFSPKDSFLDLMEHTRADGADTGAVLAELFQVLDTPPERRQHSLREELRIFPHVNGRLFEERLDAAQFTAATRALLLECCRFQWAAISPAIFGAMFQKVIELDARDRRRQLGAHYTSEANIRKVIGPLFLDELRAQFERVRTQQGALFEFHKRLRTLTFLDPACGCGNFLVVTYRELRRLELDVLRAAAAFGHATAHVFDAVKVNVDQFYGIEVEEFPAQVAQVAMWLTDHQMNVESGREFGEFFTRIPLKAAPDIRIGNALELDWEAFVPPQRLHYILGNPPFVGKQFQTAAQKADLDLVTRGLKGVGVLDYVAGWYLKAAQYLAGSQEGFASPHKARFEDARFRGHAAAPAEDDLFVTLERADQQARERIRCAFVSTNSITQGEQVGVLWSELYRRGVRIQFAHRTFRWTNEAPGKAAVHCVIVGFGRGEAPVKRLFEYASPDGEPLERRAANINAYLADAPDVVLPSRREPLCAIPSLIFGSMPNDGGHLLLDGAERAALLAVEPAAEAWLRPFVGAEEFLNGIERWCLWLPDIPPGVLRSLPAVLARVEGVRRHRQASTREATRKLAATPTLFGESRQPATDYLAIPKTSSERRLYLPIGFMPATTIASTELFTVPDATPYHFGVLQSAMHMAWVRTVCGRLESRYRYSAQIVYNNFPWPQTLTPGPSPAGGTGERGGDEGAAVGASEHASPNPSPASGRGAASESERGEGLRQRIETAARAVLDARAAHCGATLAQLYDPLTMPPALTRAHQALDRAVDAAYRPDGGARGYATDAERVAFLFRRYAALSAPLV